MSTYSINANLKMLSANNAQTILSNINSIGCDKVISLNTRRVEV